MISGAHSIIYSKNPDADRDFLKDVLGLAHVDVGHGWLIFGLPPSEIAVHPASESGKHELYFLCDEIAAFVEEMKRHGIETSPVQAERWGLLTQVTLPGGGKVGVYEPRHARPPVNGAPKKKAPAEKKKVVAKKKLVAKKAPATATSKVAAKKKRDARG